MAKILKVSPSNLEAVLKEASVFLREGKVVAVPTETFYGLAVDPWNEKALKRLYILKGRPEGKPVLLLLGEEADLFLVVKELSPLARKLMARFWPGPLTLVLPAREGLPRPLVAQTGKVAVRLTPQPVTRALIRDYGRPLTGTSANLSGRPPAKTAEEVVTYLPQVDLVLDAGPCAGRAPSTIVEVGEERIVLLREGVISFQEIVKVLGEGVVRPRRA